MTEDNEDTEDRLDLSAWEAPEPPADLADAVLARMGGTAVVPSVPETAQPRRRAWLIGGIAAAALVATAGTWALVSRGTERAAPARGSVIAERAQTLSLDTAYAELDPGAHVTWRRQGGALHVEQRAGTVSWRVDGGERMWIDAGATTASVEATGASLRVEVTMNQTDARVIGGAALTAAAVALVTVVVYEGHVKVGGSRGQPTVIVQPGSTYTVTPPAEPPVVGASVPDDELELDRITDFDVRISADESATIHTPTTPVLVVVDKPERCALVVDGIHEQKGTTYVHEGVTGYMVYCDNKIHGRGTLTVVKDDFRRPLVAPQTTRIAADGGRHAITFPDQSPEIVVGGGSGMLHVVRDSVDRTFADGVIPSGALEQGHYTFWYDASNPSTLGLYADDSAPVLSLGDVHWGPDQIQLAGESIAGSSVSMGRTSIQMSGGRFSIAIPSEDVGPLRIAHRHRGIHYFVLRSSTSTTVAVAPTSTTVAVAPTSTTLGGQAIGKVLKSAAPRIGVCTRSASSALSGKIVIEVTVRPDGTVASVRATETFDSGVSDCIVALVRVLTFPKAKSSTTFRFPFQLTGAPACDAKKLNDRGMEHISQGQHAAALAQFEAALRCTPADDKLVRLAFLASCNSKNESKARLYFKKLGPDDQSKLEQACIRSGIRLSGTPCNADALKEEGMKRINMGEHALALESFEASLACKDDPYGRQLAFMEACTSGNSARAKHWYQRLTAAQQTKFGQICMRQSPPVAFKDEPDAKAAAPGVGYLQVYSTPEAEILIDGVATGLTTPITGKQLELKPGKHKVTYVVDDNRYTYPVEITAGKTATMRKDLQ